MIMNMANDDLGNKKKKEGGVGETHHQTESNDKSRRPRQSEIRYMNCKNRSKKEENNEQKRQQTGQGYISLSSADSTHLFNTDKRQSKQAGEETNWGHSKKDYTQRLQTVIRERKAKNNIKNQSLQVIRIVQSCHRDGRDRSESYETRPSVENPETIKNIANQTKKEKKVKIKSKSLPFLQRDEVFSAASSHFFQLLKVFPADKDTFDHTRFCILSFVFFFLSLSFLFRPKTDPDPGSNKNNKTFW
ncbi:hypothetical protein ASPWEDRAFT_696727 [Aspergillus wentii DTO 134E9]|uniref:Uncharacterized protein n=1 Tax=Aspergillus wentii DTO 134E9 TaxID=1073089 RepID=A0A1L9R9K8_ASPWE|nr:uncharacterized protein ASPWEDRAFT_696727 [Aspergillus wentii DTO 134E9]OJJ31563.1 hypothetical protein ASPWEDRAFT_696727 [Aspergillus wentii DTO 134E9]